MYKLKRTDAQIEEVLNEAERLSSAGENPYWGQTYADGVAEALGWVLGDIEESPLPVEKPVAKKHK